MVYVWRCNDCGHEQEVERPIAQSDAPPLRCDCCQQADQEDADLNWTKLIQRTGFILQGKGWFRDGYQK